RYRLDMAYEASSVYVIVTRAKFITRSREERLNVFTNCDHCSLMQYCIANLVLAFEATGKICRKNYSSEKSLLDANLDIFQRK
ncbi:hypothetical protein XcyCFBP4188_20095, partial [Xanthomonas hortorum pv. cynarae]